MPLSPPQQMQLQQTLANLQGMGGGTFLQATGYDRQTFQMLATLGPPAGSSAPGEVQGLGTLLDTASNGVSGLTGTTFPYQGPSYTVRSGAQGSNPLIAGQNPSGGYCLVSRSARVIVVATIASFTNGNTLDSTKNMLMAQVGSLLANGL